jgi:hypothetical protein
MADFEARLEGVEALIDELNEMQERLRGDETWLVGTAVNYAIYLEAGTSDMDPKPFVRPALSEVRQKGIEDFLEDHTNYTAEEIADLDSLVAALALALERRIKEIITEKGLIDTGTLRASVAAVPGADPSDLATEADMPDTGEGPPYPPDYGPAVRGEIRVEAT